VSGEYTEAWVDAMAPYVRPQPEPTPEPPDVEEES